MEEYQKSEELFFAKALYKLSFPSEKRKFDELEEDSKKRFTDVSKVFVQIILDKLELKALSQKLGDFEKSI